MLLGATPATTVSPLLVKGNYVQIVRCGCTRGHSRFGIIIDTVPALGRFKVLLANSTMMAQFCIPWRVIPATGDEFERSLPNYRETVAGAKAEWEQVKTLQDGPLSELVIARR